MSYLFIVEQFAIKAVMASLNGSFEQGLETELNHMITLAMSGQARALQYAFFAERAATQVCLFLPDLIDMHRVLLMCDIAMALLSSFSSSF